jgi:hypothetical protein
MDEITTFCEHCNTDDDAGYAPPQNHSTGLIAGLVVAAALPPRPKPSSVTISPSAAQQIEALVAHLFCLGPRPIYEALCCVYGGGDLIETLESYRRLNSAVVKALGADRLPRRRCRGRRHEN